MYTNIEKASPNMMKQVASNQKTSIIIKSNANHKFVHLEVQYAHTKHHSEAQLSQLHFSYHLMTNQVKQHAVRDSSC